MHLLLTSSCIALAATCMHELTGMTWQRCYGTAGLVAFLSGAASAYITGQNIAVDGGYSVMGMY